MNEVTLPPAPNWYLSSILACANDGTAAWGSKNAIVVAKHVEKPKMLNYSIITNAHLEKVNSLAFSPEYGQPGKNFLLSGGDEHIIRIWDLDSMSAVKSQFYLDAKQKVIGVDWSKSDPTLVCSISTEGLLISWNITYTVCQRISLGKMTATCIACCPHKSNLVAIGAKSGLVYIVNLQGTGNILFKMRSHDVEITSLSWCPISTNVFQETNSEDLLLASGAKDKKIFIWKAIDGRYETQIPLPNLPQDSHQHRSKIGSSAGNFTVVSWLKPKYLLASSPYGELVSLNLSMSVRKPAWKLIHGNHMRGLFSIANVPLDCKKSDEDWRLDNKLKVWTTAQDRQIICSNIEKGICNIEYNIPTHGGFIYCIAACPLDTSRIAYGSGDALLRLWNLSESHKNEFDLKTFWQKIMGKITAIAWHPEHENILAFGTSEGRVGIYDVNNVNKPPILYRQHHRRTVYSLGWGPESTNKTPALYSCSDNELIYYQYGKTNVPPTVIIDKSCTEFAWKPDLSCMVVGYESGTLSFFNSKHEPCGKSIHHLTQAVQCLVWHPESTATDLKFSPMRHCLAATTKGNSIVIFDLKTMIDQLESESTNENEITNGISKIKLNGKDDTVQYKISAVLIGHISGVVCLAWSPHFSGHLISGSYDNTAQVWNVNTQELIGTYTGHSGPIYSCMWSPLDPDFIITGSADFSLRIWRLSEQSVVIPTEKLKAKKHKSKKNKKSILEIVTQTNTEAITDGTTNGITATADSTENSVNSENNIGNNIEQGLKPTINRETKIKSKKVNFFSVYRKTMNDKQIILASCLKLAKKKLMKRDNPAHTDDETDNVEVPSIFGTKEDISKIINIEQMAHARQGQRMATTEMNIWNGNLRQQLETAARDLQLDDFLVSLAPSLSMKMWQNMCEAYAVQLIQESNPTKAICYLLCIHKIHRAIEVLMESRMFREAYVLAKCKLEPDDATLNNILEKWMKALLETGQFEEATQCCIQLGDLPTAAKILSRRKDILTLETAAELAILAGEKELSESILDRIITESLVNLDIEKCRELIDKFPVTKYRSIHVEATEQMKIIREKYNDSFIISWLEEKSDYGLLSIIKDCRKKIKNAGYKQLVALSNQSNPESRPVLWMMVSETIALAVASPTEEKRIHHIVSALGLISQYDVMHPVNSNESRIVANSLIYFISTLDSKTFSVSSILKNVKIPAYKSLRAYVCLGLLNWLIDKIKAEEFNENIPFCVMKIIEKTLPDGMDQSTVRYWTRTSEINQLETSYTTIISDTEKTDEDKENFAKSLEEIREKQEKFKEERIVAPSPILIYSKALELSDLLTDVDMKKSFNELAIKTWNSAVSTAQS